MTSGLALGLAVGADAALAKVEGDTIVLGSAISLTGKYATNGVHAQNGYDLAVKMINESGGVTVDGKSYKLKVIYYDDESTPARGAQLAERLIKQDGVQFMLGPYSSGLTKAITPVTEKYKIPMVEAEGASRSLFTQGYKYLFAVLSTSEQYLASAIDLAAEMAEKEGRSPADIKIAMAFENDPFSLDVRAGVVDDAKKYDMKIVIDDKLPRDLSDMSATLTKAKALKPDLLIVSGHSKGAATAVRTARPSSWSSRTPRRAWSSPTSATSWSPATWPWPPAVTTCCKTRRSVDCSWADDMKSEPLTNKRKGPCEEPLDG